MDVSKPSIPRAPLALGLAGLLPFWVLALALVAHATSDFGLARVEFALSTYAAIIVSFLGGIRWGLAVRAGDENLMPYAISVVPSLAGWAALAAPGPWRLVILGSLALALGPIDYFYVRSGAAPDWFGRLRLMLSTGAGAALLVAALG